jgi:hypothetical protein
MFAHRRIINQRLERNLIRFTAIQCRIAVAQALND